MRLFLSSALLGAAAVSLAAPRPEDVVFVKRQLDAGANETAAFADVNGDSRVDLVSGENWFEHPAQPDGEWRKHQFRELGFANNYIDAFSDLPLDVNGDGRVDIVTCTFFSRKISWYENPGPGGGIWREHLIEQGWSVEFMFLVDLNNDGRAEELLPQFGGHGAVTAWYELRGGKFVRHIVANQALGHGIGAGDINGDGRNDILTPRGWLEAPAVPGEAPWPMRQEWFAKKQTGFLHVVDIDKDGRNDVLYSHAHDYGIFWLRQDGDGKWTEFRIDDSWSQAHATALVDLNGDGQSDFVTGKRYLVNHADPGAREPLGLYWYQWRANGGAIEWIRHVIDYASSLGGGMQIASADLGLDGDLDLAVGGKTGVFLLENISRPRGKAK